MYSFLRFTQQAVLKFCAVQLALAMLLIPGRVFGSEVRPRRFKCVERCACYVHSSFHSHYDTS